MLDRSSTSARLLPPLFACLTSLIGCGSEAEPNPGAAGSTSQGGTSAGSASGGTGGAPIAGSATGGGGSGATTAGTSSGGATGGVGGGGAGGAATGGTATGGRGGAGGASGGTGGSAGSGGGGGGSSTGFSLTTPAWTSQASCSASDKAGCGIFPKDNIGTNIGGMNKSPEFNWTEGPSGTQSYAIVMHDLSNLMQNKPFVHWVMWNIPGATRMLPAGLETTAMPSVPQGSSQRSFSGNGYQGSGKCGNVYEFVLYALPMATFTPGGTNQTAAADALAATNAPKASLRARSGAPGCTE
jgi:phosphatidylethanolamine-binding protein (PEBP) family uncharacterized protein